VQCVRFEPVAFSGVNVMILKHFSPKVMSFFTQNTANCAEKVSILMVFEKDRLVHK
jgi:hypothetical protein